MQTIGCINYCIFINYKNKNNKHEFLKTETKFQKINKIDCQKSPEPAASLPMYISGVASSRKPQCLYNSKSRTIIKLAINKIRAWYTNQNLQMTFPLKKKPSENTSPGSSEKYPAIERSIRIPCANTRKISVSESSLESWIWYTINSPRPTTKNNVHAMNPAKRRTSLCFMGGPLMVNR